MTVATTTNREQYATNGVTTAFTIHFPFFDDVDVNAVFVDGGGAATALALSTDFSVTGGNGAGGMLTTVAPLASGGVLTIYRDIPFTQEDDYVENDPLPADTLESGFDRAAMRDQQLQDAVGRALTFPVTIDPGVSGNIPVPAADQVLGWNAAGTALENKNLPAGTAVYSSTANTNLGVSTEEAVTPKALHDSVYNPNGLHMVPVLSTSMIPDPANPPGVGSSALGSGRSQFVGYDFDKDVPEYIYFTLPMPPSYDGGNVTFRCVWTSAAAAGTVTNIASWALAGISIADGESLNQAFTSTTTSADAFQGANLIHISPLSAPISIGGSPAGGEVMVFRLFRNASAGADTYDQDARLLAVLVYFSTSKGIDA